MIWGKNNTGEIWCFRESGTSSLTETCHVIICIAYF